MKFYIFFNKKIIIMKNIIKYFVRILNINYKLNNFMNSCQKIEKIILNLEIISSIMSTSERQVHEMFVKKKNKYQIREIQPKFTPEGLII